MSVTAIVLTCIVALAASVSGDLRPRPNTPWLRGVFPAVSEYPFYQQAVMCGGHVIASSVQNRGSGFAIKSTAVSRYTAGTPSWTLTYLNGTFNPRVVCGGGDTSNTSTVLTVSYDSTNGLVWLFGLNVETGGIQWSKTLSTGRAQCHAGWAATEAICVTSDGTVVNVDIATGALTQAGAFASAGPAVLSKSKFGCGRLYAVTNYSKAFTTITGVSKHCDATPFAPTVLTSLKVTTSINVVLSSARTGIAILLMSTSINSVDFVQAVTGKGVLMKASKQVNAAVITDGQTPPYAWDDFHQRLYLACQYSDVYMFSALDSGNMIIDTVPLTHQTTGVYWSEVDPGFVFAIVRYPGTSVFYASTIQGASASFSVAFEAPFWLSTIERHRIGSETYTLLDNRYEPYQSMALLKDNGSGTLAVQWATVTATWIPTSFPGLPRFMTVPGSATPMVLAATGTVNFLNVSLQTNAQQQGVHPAVAFALFDLAPATVSRNSFGTSKPFVYNDDQTRAYGTCKYQDHTTLCQLDVTASGVSWASQVTVDGSITWGASWGRPTPQLPKGSLATFIKTTIGANQIRAFNAANVSLKDSAPAASMPTDLKAPLLSDGRYTYAADWYSMYRADTASPQNMITVPFGGGLIGPTHFALLGGRTAAVATKTKIHIWNSSGLPIGPSSVRTVSPPAGETFVAGPIIDVDTDPSAMSPQPFFVGTMSSVLHVDPVTAAVKWRASVGRLGVEQILPMKALGVVISVARTAITVFDYATGAKKRVIEVSAFGSFATASVCTDSCGRPTTTVVLSGNFGTQYSAQGRGVASVDVVTGKVHFAQVVAPTAFASDGLKLPVCVRGSAVVPTVNGVVVLDAATGALRGQMTAHRNTNYPAGATSVEYLSKHKVFVAAQSNIVSFTL